MDPYAVLIGGGVLSALMGLLGIAITKLEGTPIVNQLSEDELKTYRNERLIKSGVAFCTIHKGEFRPGPGASLTACEECLPPAPVIGNGKWEPHTRAERKSELDFGKSYTPIYKWWPELYQKEDE